MQVWAESRGGVTNASAYFLVYLRGSEVQLWPQTTEQQDAYVRRWFNVLLPAYSLAYTHTRTRMRVYPRTPRNSVLPPALVADVETDNERFRKELADFDEKQKMHQIEQRVRGGAWFDPAMIISSVCVCVCVCVSWCSLLWLVCL